MADLFLGLEGSTQSFKAVVIDDHEQVADTIMINYDEIQPKGFGLKGGYWELGNGVVYGSPEVWAKAMDMGLLELKASGITGDIKALSGDGQQHGHTALRKGLNDISMTLKPDKPLDEQLTRMGAFARRARIGDKRRFVGPIWKDDSTNVYVKALIEEAGGLQAFIQLTGSGGFERFTGPQYWKFRDTAPEAFANSVQLPLVSSFHNGLLGGGYCITPGDALGTSLMDVTTRTWSQRMVQAIDKGLYNKLALIMSPSFSCGNTSKFVQERYGINAHLFPWEGDNPSSLIGVGGVVPGRVVISLGTSDTVFGNTGQSLVVDPEGELCVFGAPTNVKHNMYLGCWKNGSKAREAIAERFGMDWELVSDYLLRTGPDEKKMGVYWFDSEITPKAKAGEIRTDYLQRMDIYNMKAIVEGKIMSMLARLEKINVGLNEIYVTAGASENDGILQTIADVTGAIVYRQKVKDSAPLGGALRARYGYMKMKGLNPNWEKIVEPFIEIKKTFWPDATRSRDYKRMFPKYKAFEAKCAQGVR
jgi:xylulokinase